MNIFTTKLNREYSPYLPRGFQDWLTNLWYRFVYRPSMDRYNKLHPQKYDENGFPIIELKIKTTKIQARPNPLYLTASLSLKERLALRWRIKASRRVRADHLWRMMFRKITWTLGEPILIVNPQVEKEMVAQMIEEIERTKL